MTVKDVLKSRGIRSLVISAVEFLPDIPYIKLYYWATTGKRLNLKNPQGFHEKLNWLKLHGDYSQYVDFCDKIKVRDIIKEKIGDGYMFPLLGWWKTFEEIDFESLPEEFVLKCNHDSGSTKIISGKSKLSEQEWNDLRVFFNRRVNYDFYLAGREPCYKGIKRYIIAEPLMKNEDGNNETIRDYKFICFDGKPELMYVNLNKDTHTRRDFFDMDFQHLNVTNLYPQSNSNIERPANFDKMVEIATLLSQGMKVVRIDLYDINGKIYFGEYTFFHCGGFCLFKPDEWERRLGDLIDIEDD